MWRAMLELPAKMALLEYAKSPTKYVTWITSPFFF